MEQYIYTLTDPIDGLVKYIGKTNNIQDRLKRHISEWSINSAPFTNKNVWLNSLIVENHYPIIDIIDTGDDMNINDLEKYWISQFICWGFILTNQTPGGDGVDWSGKKHKESTKILLRANNKNKKTVVMFDINMNPLKKFISVRGAERDTGIKRQLIKFSCNGRGKAGGCYFKFSNIEFIENVNWFNYIEDRKYNYNPIKYDISKEKLSKMMHLTQREILNNNGVVYNNQTRHRLMGLFKKYKLK